MKNEKIKENIELIPLTRDFMFKHIFTNNPNILKKFLISVLKLNINPELASIVVESNELVKSRNKEYHKTVDIYACINNNLRIDIEVNTEKFSAIKARNALYLNKIAIDTTNSGFTYQDISKIYFYQLNLNVHKLDKNLDEEYLLMSSENHQLLLDNYKIVCKSLDYYKELYYNQGKKANKDVIWLSILKARDLSELEEMAGLVMDKDEKEKFVSDCNNASKDTKWLSEWNSDLFAEMVKHNVLEDAKNEGIEEGFEQGIEKGIKQGIKQGVKKGIEEGIEQNKITMIKGMLKENLDIKTISKVASVPINEIKKIEKSLKD